MIIIGREKIETMRLQRMTSHVAPNYPYDGTYTIVEEAGSSQTDPDWSGYGRAQELPQYDGSEPDFTNWHKSYRRLRRASEIIGASTVAIDNKIEQAMDLVKSHLMFAVREEVEVLKVQIKELLEKNSQLEYENSVLRASATPETLAKLQAANPQQTATS